MKKIYVRITPKSGATSFYRCGLLFDSDWREIDADGATIARLKAEQMLEVSDTLPEGAAVVGNGFVDEAPQSSVTTASAATPSTPKERHLAMVAAARDLPRDVQSNWKKGGSPTTEALSTVLGYVVTAAERDAAWAVVMEEGRV